MDLQALIDEITELVMHQLTAVEPRSAADGGARSARSSSAFVVAMGEGERGAELIGVHVRELRKAGARVTVVPSAIWPRARVERALSAEAGTQVLEAPPASWSGLLRESSALVVPNLALHELAALSHLLSATPATAAMLAALLEGRTVVAGNDDIQFLTVNAARLPKAILEGVRGYVAKVGAMGVRLLEGAQLSAALSAPSNAVRTASSAAQGRNVLTREDVESYLRGGASTIEVAAGTIVTPLAREVARQSGVEIVFR